MERRTNLGGITEKDLTEQLGKPADSRQIESTEEKNIRYHLGNFELQFIIGKDGTADHVNLKKSMDDLGGGYQQLPISFT